METQAEQQYPTNAYSSRPTLMHGDKPMPRYKCHKEVFALKIAGISINGGTPEQETDGSATITPAEPGYAPFRVPREFMLKHKPQVGGYYVVYEDGYASWSPAKAFETGYTLL